MLCFQEAIKLNAGYYNQATQNGAIIYEERPLTFLNRLFVPQIENNFVLQ